MQAALWMAQGWSEPSEETNVLHASSSLQHNHTWIHQEHSLLPAHVDTLQHRSIERELDNGN